MVRILLAAVLIFALAGCGDNEIKTATPRSGGTGAEQGANNEGKPAALAISGTPQVAVRIDRPFSFKPEVANADTANLKFYATKPAWLTLDPTTGVLSGTPTGDKVKVGTYAVELTAVDGAGEGRSSTMKFEVEVGVPWTSLTPKVVNPKSATVVLNGKVYFIGGKTKDGVSGQVHEFNPESGVWDSSSGTLTTPRYDAAAAAVNGKIYIFGGQTEKVIVEGQAPIDQVVVEQLASVEEYDPVTKQSTVVSQLPHSRHAMSSCVFDGKIYLIGGIENTLNAETVVGKLEIFNPNPPEGTEKWTTGTSSSNPRYNHRCFSESGHIIVLGGLALALPYPPMEIYTPDPSGGPGKWDAKGALPADVPFFSDAHDGQIYLFGGVQENKDASSVWQYNGSAWTPKESMPAGRSYFSGAKVGDAFFVFGDTIEKYRPVFDYQ